MKTKTKAQILRQLLFIGLFLNCLAVNAQDLLVDIVKVEDGKYKFEELRLITTSDKSIQLKIHSECSQAVISRDMFVFYTTLLAIKVIVEITPEDATNKYLDELIGNPDAEINLYMTKNGLQIEVKTSDGVKRTTTKWEEL